jgi:hypothetical protein
MDQSHFVLEVALSQYHDTGSPGTSWGVWLKELSGYLQGDFSGTLGDMPYSGNVGVRLIHTNLNVTQYLTGAPGAYGDEPADRHTTSPSAATTTCCRRPTSR